MRHRTALAGMLVVLFALAVFLPNWRLATFGHASRQSSLDALLPLSPIPPHLHRIGVFIGVNGITFTSDGSRFAYHSKYLSREKVVKVHSAVLDYISAQLRTAGLFEESESNDPQDISIPISYSIEIGRNKSNRTFSWISQGNCSVPEKYLAIFEKLNSKYHSKVVNWFVVHNRNVARQHEAWNMPRQLRQ